MNPSTPGKMQLLRTMQRTMKSYALVSAGDRIMVAVSGGKDSYTMLDLLCQAQKRAPFRFELCAVHLDQGQPGYDGKPLADWLESFGAPYEILREDTYSVVKQLVKEGDTYCAPCSRMRRGVLYSAAERLGCNKIALGHHREDTLQTLLLNLLYAGKLQAMPAKYLTDDGRFEVIRPLIDCSEREIAAHAKAAGYPILPCNLCGSQDGLRRKQVESLLDQLETTIPDVRQVMLHALKNVRPSHLLDQDVAAAWAERRPELRPDLRASVPLALRPGHLPILD
ncbi:MAG TPA: tRNA 2-thiocytidine(32) synthetase TtcA [Pseudomonadota bacterium]|nr:tRNA 2-thiocytidine(32) synthetase TtcA [Pseudomonadota bacterium]HNI60580.1 tRNA 2-thiocytidine(32) synthetase TtcA [Pseudomonadota bacterium]HNK45710.1 tRNA 2-thiocytidine(32) synthetase TtcA [Pseudomonadota bacterium]HNN51747.1 tRNA 2-thiocytidine(32) synthetase TtcA [Pseudomonadota bacterium]HNO68998.1 tRNA 2-thiocytidine(32) synthetase TtcA [Pseudomonadota bacterium]